MSVECVEKREDSGLCGKNAFYDIFSRECVPDDDGVNVPDGGLGIPPNNHCYSKTGLKKWLSTDPTKQDPYTGGRFSAADHDKIFEDIGEIEDWRDREYYYEQSIAEATIQREQLIADMTEAGTLIDAIVNGHFLEETQEKTESNALAKRVFDENFDAIVKATTVFTPNQYRLTFDDQKRYIEATLKYAARAEKFVYKDVESMVRIVKMGPSAEARAAYSAGWDPTALLLDQTLKFADSFDAKIIMEIIVMESDHALAIFDKTVQFATTFDRDLISYLFKEHQMERGIRLLQKTLDKADSFDAMLIIVVLAAEKIHETGTFDADELRGCEPTEWARKLFDSTLLFVTEYEQWDYTAFARLNRQFATEYKKLFEFEVE